MILVFSVQSLSFLLRKASRLHPDACLAVAVSGGHKTLKPRPPKSLKAVFYPSSTSLSVPRLFLRTLFTQPVRSKYFSTVIFHVFFRQTYNLVVGKLFVFALKRTIYCRLFSFFRDEDVVGITCHRHIKASLCTYHYCSLSEKLF